MHTRVTEGREGASPQPVWGRAWGGPASTLRVGALAVRRSPRRSARSRRYAGVAHRPASIPVASSDSVHSPDSVCDFHALFHDPQAAFNLYCLHGTCVPRSAVRRPAGGLSV